MNGVLRCCICGRRLEVLAARVHAGPVGPICAKRVGAAAVKRTRMVEARPRGRRDERQLDWVALTQEAA